MPANLTPQYREAEKAFREAKTTEEKITALQEMLATIPKHKGTEKLQGELKKRLSKLRLDSEKKGKAGPTHNPYRVEKEGAGQLVLLGFPNTGKSAILGALSNAKVTVAEYPFATPIPLAGMIPYEDIKIQLIDTPPIVPEEVPGELVGTFLRGDGLIIVIDASIDHALDQLSGTLGMLAEKRLLRAEIPRGVKAFRRDDLLVLANKMDLSGALDNLEIIRDLYPDLELVPVSAQTGINMEKLPAIFFRMLDVIRVYSKVPGKDPDMDAPFILVRGSTVLDMAVAVHKDFGKRLEKARIWGSARFDGQPVARDFVLADKDIVELHV